MTQVLHARLEPRSPYRALRRMLERAAQRRELAAARRAADRELLRDEHPSLRLAWRVRELVAPESRRGLADTIRSIVEDANGHDGVNASSLNRDAVNAEKERLLALADRLADLDSPADARGVLLTQHLVTDGGSPLYAPTSPQALPFYVDAARDALDLR